jgi:hypothetical protein
MQFSIVLRVELNGLAFVEFVVAVLSKSVQSSREKNLKKIQEYQIHTKRQQKLNISDLESTFNSSDDNC